MRFMAPPLSAIHSDFLVLLEALGLSVKLHRFDDHQALDEEDLTFDDTLPVIVTAKDAIKLGRITSSAVADNIWSLDVEAVY